MNGAPHRPAPDDLDFAKDVAGGLRSVFDRVGEFFHLFDLSFFVSGTATFSAIVYWFLRQETALALARLPSWVYVVGLAVACYICGLLSFAAGRVITKRWRKKFPVMIKAALAGHGAESKVTAYLDGDEKPWRLYERLWVEVRQTQKYATSFSLLRRYWVMAATYDGVAISCFVWAFILSVEPPIVRPSYANLLLPVAAIASGLVSFIQGHSYFKYQVYEIVATVAGSKSNLDL